MANDISTIQSLKAVDAWIDVINANINGGVRTAFKASRLRFAGTNTALDRAPTSTSLPLQLPEPGLITANTVIDWTQGAITSSTENTHLAIQGDGFFLLASPDAINPTTGLTSWSSSAKFLLTRDGEFSTNSAGFLVNSAGYYLVTVDLTGGTTGVPRYSSAVVAGASSTRAIFNDIDMPNGPAPPNCVRLTDFLTLDITTDFGNTGVFGPSALVKVPQGQQNLRYSTYGSTVFDFGFQTNGAALSTMDSALILQDGTAADASILAKSLEASNSSMTQSVPELSLAQKLFSALTKVLQIGQTNTDSVLNLIR